MATKAPQGPGFLQRARTALIVLGGVYVALVALIITPSAQQQVVFMHNLRLPFFAQYDLPEKYGLAPFKTHNVRIHTADNETLGAWFTLADPFYASHKHALAEASPESTQELTRAALHAHPTVLFLHGNAATRALSSRVAQYKAYASRLRANVLAPDYRGFGDSTGAPSEDGLRTDGLAAWEWLRASGAASENILVVGNSLGTGVAVQLASALQEQGEALERPRGVVLLAPFSKLETLLETYYIMGVLPLLAPLRTFPWIASLVKRKFLVHRFDSLAKILSIDVPLLLVHAEDDWDIPHAHSQTLFDAFLEQHLPMLPEITSAMGGASGEVIERMAAVAQERTALRRELVASHDLARLGRVETFSKGRTGAPVVFLNTKWGGHDRVGLVEGVQDYIAEMFGLDRWTPT